MEDPSTDGGLDGTGGDRTSTMKNSNLQKLAIKEGSIEQEASEHKPRRPFMESSPLKLDAGQGHEDVDRISALPDHLCLDILERLDLPSAVRAGVASTRWRHLLHQLSRLHFHHTDFDHGFRSSRKTMDAFTAALQTLLAGSGSRTINTLVLTFFLPSPYEMSCIGRAVEDVASRGETQHLEFNICSPGEYPCFPSMLGQDFMSFSRDFPVAFRWLTMLTLEELEFGHSDVADLINAGERLQRLDLIDCEMVERSALQIDTPRSGIRVLCFICFSSARIELVSVPKLRQVWYQYWRFENPPVHFGYVPELGDVSLFCHAKPWQAPFALSDCFSTTATNLSKLCLDFGTQMIWVKPEHPKQLTAMFTNLTGVELSNIFPECDLIWTLFILEAAPALNNFSLSRDRHSVDDTMFEPGSVPEKTNVLWKPSKDFKHTNLKLLAMSGFEDEDKVNDYIRLIMDRAVVLEIIELRGERGPCKYCNDSELERRSQENEASRRRVKERLVDGSSSSLEIIVCSS